MYSISHVVPTPRIKLNILTLLMVWLLLASAGAQTFNDGYDIDSYSHTSGSNDYVLSIPSHNGTPLSAIKGVVVSYAGVGGSTAFEVNDRWSKWLYANGLAYLGTNDTYAAGSTTVNTLTEYATQTLGSATYPELEYVPLLTYGESAGGSSAYNLAFDAPERVIAFVVESTRFFADVDEATAPAAVKAVPGYFRWGEWDKERWDQGYHSYGEASIRSMIERGALWMCSVEARQTHATKRHAFEEAIGFFSLMLPLRYDYQAGVAGNDPTLGAVNLIALDTNSGLRGEHGLAIVQTDGPDPLDYDDDNYVNFLKDWQSSDPYFASAANFDRNEGTHSWIANTDLAYFWATGFSLGHQDLLVSFPDLINDDLGTNVLTKFNSWFPNYFVTGQSIRMNVDPVDFPSATSVEFYANGVKVATDTTAPFEHSYSFNTGEAGVYALFPIAVADDGERSVGPRRMVQVYENEDAGNHAPTIAPIGTLSGNPSASLSIPVSIADVESDASTLSLTWIQINRTQSISSGSYTVTTSGSGATRSLDIDLPPTAGIIWGLLKVSDGSMSTTTAVMIESRGDGSEAPFFVGEESVSFVGPIFANGSWSGRISVRVYDYDTDPENLVLTASSSSTTSIPDENVKIGGSGQFRYVQVKPVSGGATITLSLSDGNSSVTKSFYCGPKAQDNMVPVISQPDNQSSYFATPSDPLELRVFDLYTDNKAVLPSDAVLEVSVSSDNQTLIPNGSISVTKVGARRQVQWTPTFNETGTATLTATVTDEQGLTASTSFGVSVSAPPGLTTEDAALADGLLGSTYSEQLIATGGIPPYAWAVTAGALPDGLSLASNGSLSGTPSAGGNFAFTAQVDDSDSSSTSANFTVFIGVPDTTPPATIDDLSATSVSDSAIELSWTAPSDDDSGVASYDLRISSAAIASESDFESATAAAGLLSPSAAGTTESYTFTGLDASTPYYFSIRSTDAEGNISLQSTSLVVTTDAPPTLYTVGEFDTASDSTVPHTINLASTNSGWYAYPSNGISGNYVRSLTSGGNSDGYLQIARNYSQTTPHTIVLWIDPQTLGLTPGASYSLQFDYKVDRTDPAAAYDSGAMVRCALADNNGTYSQASSLISGTSMTVTGDGNIAFNYSDTEFSVGDETDWTTHSTTLTWTYTDYGSATRLLVAISGEGFGQNINTFDPSNPYTYLGIDNVRLLLDGGVSPPGDAPVIEAQAMSQALVNGQSANLSITATGDAGSLSYQWYLGESGDTSTPIDGATTANYTTSALTADGSFWVRVTDTNGSTDSDTVSLQVSPLPNKTIAHYGSSTVFGYTSDYEPSVAPHDQGNYIPGDDDDDIKQWMQGYSFMTRELLADNGWIVRNRGIPGWNSIQAGDNLNDHLLNTGGSNDVNFGYVFTGLTLGNEGLSAGADAYWVHDNFRYGIHRINQSAYQNSISPLVGLVYMKDAYGADEYAAVQRMNRYLNSLDVPSVNLLGALDDGNGHYASGYGEESIAVHPNDAGHLELFYAYVPSVYDALELGKDVPSRQEAPGYLRIDGASDNSPLLYRPADTRYAQPIHSFALRFLVRTTSNGAIASIQAKDANDSDAAVTAALQIDSGLLEYHSTASGTQSITTGITLNDGTWHEILLSHYYASERTLLFVNGTQVGSINEKIEPLEFILGGPGSSGLSAPSSADYEDLMIWRSALNADEAQALNERAMLQASMEVYAPLHDAAFADGQSLTNLAQSLAEVVVTGAGCQAIDDSAEHPSNFTTTDNTASVDLSWTDNSSVSVGFIIERSPLAAAADDYEVVLDEDAATYTGTWNDITDANGYNGDYKEVASVTTTPDASVTYTPDLSGQSGRYALYINRPDNSTMSNFAMTLANGYGSSHSLYHTYRKIHNTQSRAGQWIYMGSYDLQDGASLSYTNEFTTDGDEVRADAFRFVKEQDTADWQTLATLPVGSTSYTDASATAGIPYAYRIRIVKDSKVSQVVAETSVRSNLQSLGLHSPVITSQASDSNFPYGENQSLEVIAEGFSLTYQWYQGYSSDENSPVSGGTASSLEVTAPSLPVNYWVRVSNEFGYTDSHTINLIPLTGPRLLQHPSSTTIASGASTTFSVLAESTGTLSYQWYQGASGDRSNPISGATGASLSTPSLTAAATYWVELSDDLGTTNSASATASIENTDTTAPSAIADLSAGSTTISSIDLSWTAPGDDGVVGTAASYDLRVSTTAINDENDFNAATTVENEPSPSSAGSTETITLGDLSAGTIYYLAIRTSDAAGNLSALSNVVSASTEAAPTTGSDKHLLFNFGSTESGHWNNFSHSTNFTSASATLSDPIYDDGTTTSGIDAEFTTDGAYGSTESHLFTGNNYATQTSADPDAASWLTDSASNSVIRIKTGPYTFTLLIDGLAAGSYNLEAYIAVDSAYYAYGDLTAKAGISGATAATNVDYDSANFAVTSSSQTQLAIWNDIVVGEGETLELSITGNGTEWALINAVRLTQIDGNISETPYSIWADGAGLSGDDALSTSTPFNDSVSNLMKYALGIPGDAPTDSSALPSGSINESGNYFDFTFQRERSELTYIVQTSPTLAADSWLDYQTNPGSVGESVTVQIPIDVSGKSFSRLKVEE